MSGKIKGFILQSRRAFITEKFGLDALSRVMAKLPEADQATLNGVILASSWFPSGLCLRLDEAIIETLGGRSEQAFRELGRKSADDNLVKFQAGFMRGKTPQRFLAQTPSIYRMYYEVGARSYEATGEMSGVLVTTGAENVTVGDCLTVMGWHERALELVGARHPKMIHPVCRARGGADCRYEVSWIDVKTVTF